MEKTSLQNTKTQHSVRERKDIRAGDKRLRWVKESGQW